MKRQMKIGFGKKKHFGEVLIKLKNRESRATSLSTYDFSTLYATLPHNLIKEKLHDLIGWTFKRALKNHGLLDLACSERNYIIYNSVMTERLFSHSLTKSSIHFGHVRMYATPYPISRIIFILDLETSSNLIIQTNCWNSNGYKLRPSRS